MGNFINHFNNYKFPKITYYQIQSDRKLSDRINTGKRKCIRNVSFETKKSLSLYILKSAIEDLSKFTFFDKTENKVLYRRKISDVKSNNIKISIEAVWKSKCISDYNLDSEEYYCEED